jgi:hypothetical protein
MGRSSLRNPAWRAATTGFLVATVLSGCSYFPEASFTLAEESRLPRWIELDSGQKRSEVRVTMDYYVGGSRHATFTVTNSFGRTIRKVTGELRGHYPIERKTKLLGCPDGYPSYEIISVGNQIEIIEHRRMEPIVYITDDPSVWSELMNRD